MVKGRARILAAATSTAAILRKVFEILQAPPIEMLKSALEASRTKKQTRLDWIRSERERLAHGQRVAEERADLTRGSLPRVHRAALENLETVLQAKEQFEQRLAPRILASVRGWTGRGA